MSFPSEEFNDIPANLAADPTAQYRFWVRQPQGSNVWVHAANPWTSFPHPVMPTGYSEPNPPEVDTRIQVVWPHDEHGNFAPVDRATRVNIAADVFKHGTTLSVPPSTNLLFVLFVAKGNGPVEVGPSPSEKTTYTVNGKAYPRWVASDVPVQPGQPYHFLVDTGTRGEPGAYPTIWTHAADARTFLPSPQVPPPCSP